jgi:serine/threonine-protein kinase
VAIAAIAVIAVTLVALALGERSSAAPPTGEIVTPNLVGMPVDRARSVTEDAGLVLGSAVYRQTDAYLEGTVISQTPGPGTPVAAGSTIAPTVSTARELIAVPDVVGSPQSDAIFTITTAGLRVGSTTRAPDASIPAGAVISTVPEAGRLVAVGTTVAIVVSSGPPLPASPSATPPPPAASQAPTGTPQPSGPPGPDPNASPDLVPSTGPGISPEPAIPTPSVTPSPS